MTGTPGTSLLQLSQNFSEVLVSPILPFQNFSGTFRTIGGPDHSSSFTQWTGGRGCALEGRKAALGEATSQRMEHDKGGSKGTGRAGGAGFGKSLPKPPHRKRSSEEQGDEARGDEAMRRGAEASGGGKGENSAHGDEVTQPSSSKRSRGEKWARRWH